MTNEPGSVIFSGENPGLTLYKPGTDEIVAAASYWRSVYSASGDGNALLLWVSPEAAISGISGTMVITDNPGMAQIVAERFTGHFENFRDWGFPGTAPTYARFAQEGDGRWYHHVVANTGDQVIDLNWWDVIQHDLIQRADFELGPTKWDLATVICPCESASIMVNNQEIKGEVRVTRGDSTRSSAFLAFSETWRERP
jgi:hypothetical protein